jgi:3-methylcrotonyl-CoA carboxylase alpha subunit
VAGADEAWPIGAAEAAQSYLDGEKLVAVARAAGCDAVHPGYGFLSENAGFARRCAAAGLVFIGPPPEAIEAMGSKIGSRARMQKAGVPVVPGSDGASQDLGALAKHADRMGYPVLVKASAGGGGKGMRVVTQAKDFQRLRSWRAAKPRTPSATHDLHRKVSRAAAAHRVPNLRRRPR